MTDYKGNKVTDPDALAERVAQFVHHCQPDGEAMAATVFQEGNIVIDNDESPNFTIISIDTGARDAPGLLLNVASTITALGISIHEAVVSTECKQFPCCTKSGERRFFKVSLPFPLPPSLPPSIDSSMAAYCISL